MVHGPPLKTSAAHGRYQTYLVARLEHLFVISILGVYRHHNTHFRRRQAGVIGSNRSSQLADGASIGNVNRYDGSAGALPI
jgi:hypothetical protein